MENERVEEDETMGTLSSFVEPSEQMRIPPVLHINRSRVYEV
jgi:hypothetical protein